MLRMAMILQQRLMIRLTFIFGYCSSIFVKTERLLRDDDYLEAMDIISSRKELEKYRSFLDFMFSNLFLEWKPECLRYYKEEAIQLRKHPDVTEKKIKQWDRHMFKMAKIAKRLVDEQIEVPWSEFSTLSFKLGGNKLSMKRVSSSSHLVKKKEIEE